MRLRDLPLSTEVRSEAHIETLNHYATCTACRPLGLATIRRTKISCVEAIKVCLRGDRMLHDEMYCDTLEEVLVHEHIYGTAIVGQDGAFISPAVSTLSHSSCNHAVCAIVRCTWRGFGNTVPSDTMLARLIERIMTAAQAADWPINPLLQALRDRKAILENNVNDAKKAKKRALRAWRLEIVHIDEMLEQYA